ncbi:MAG: AraC family transcriptional regulator [Prevotella sp.]|nr:AraC family transcriptional regulator [Prevotella sp.]
MPQTLYLLFFAANLAFILTNLYGWLLKWFYRPRAYSEEFGRLFPAQWSVGWLYLLQTLELPYLFRIGQVDTLLYANAFALLVFPLLMLVMCEGYFFPEVRHKRSDYWIFLPPVVPLLPLFLQAVGLVTLPDGYRPMAFVLTGVLFAWYFWRTIRMGQRIGQAVRRVNEDTYADSDDFPTRFAQKIQWLPTSICVLMAVNFCLDDPTAKAIRDIAFTVVNIWFCIFTLNPWRQPFDISGKNTEGDDSDIADAPMTTNADAEDDTTADTAFRLSDDRYDELRRRLDSLLTDERIFTEQHITADTLMQRLGINSNYLTEVIRRSGYSSFYDMICQHRVRHAIALIRQYPDRRLLDIATDCGFTSPSSMSKAFASQGKPSPSVFRKPE